MTRAWQRLEAHAGHPVRRHFLHLLAWLDRGSYYAILLAMGLMTVLVCAQVVARYLLGTSVPWPRHSNREAHAWSRNDPKAACASAMRGGSSCPPAWSTQGRTRLRYGGA